MSISRLHLLNYLIDYCGYHNYLEIGSANGDTIKNIRCNHRIGIDPNSSLGIRATSDDYFANSKGKFGLIFIDGDHRCEQVLRDILNSLDHLATDGTIVVHDCLPLDVEETRQIANKGGMYTGDGWRVIASMSRFPQLDVVVGNFDHGCAIIKQRPNPFSDGPAFPPSIRSWTWGQYEQALLFPILSWPEVARWIAQ